MRLLLYLAVVVSCETGRVSRGLEHDLFPNFKTVFHGHGAISYQNVHLENHASIPIPKHHPEHSYTIQHEDQKVSAIELLEPVFKPTIEHYIISKTEPYIDDHEGHIAVEAILSPQYYDDQYGNDVDYVEYH